MGYNWTDYILLALMIIFLVLSKKISLLIQNKIKKKGGSKMRNNKEPHHFKASILETIHAIGASIYASILLA